jgi:hypothetical protein
VLRAYRDVAKARGTRFEAAVNALPQTVKDALDGDLGIDLSLPTWLRQQSEAKQRAALGPTRWRMWKAGRLPLSAMINSVTRQPLTIAELKARGLKKVS